MLTANQLKEIREHLEKAGDPLFFFGNDADGLCSFLLLARAYGKGRGVAIKSFPELNVSYARKLHELNPDYVFILDKPIVSEEFLQESRNLNIPVVWIDHHDVENPIQISDHPKNQKDFSDVENPVQTSNSEAKLSEEVYYYNTTKNEQKSFEPVTYLAWKIAGRKEDLWLAVCGCIGDNFMPEFANEFAREFPDLLSSVKTAFEALYESDIGKITRIMNFALKDRTSNVVKMMRLLLKVKNPAEILIDEPKNHLLFRFKQVDKKYQQLIEKAVNFSKGKLVYFQYGGDLSLSADIANELYYKFPNKIIVVAYIKGTKTNISIRGKNARDITLKAIEGLDASGGGHSEATGAKVNLEDLPKFKERIEKLVR